MIGKLSGIIDEVCTDFAVIDENDFQFARHLNPEVVVAFRLPDPRPMQWLIRRDGLDLRDAVNAFFGDAARSGLLARLEREAKAEAHDFDAFEVQDYSLPARLEDYGANPWHVLLLSFAGIALTLGVLRGRRELRTGLLLAIGLCAGGTLV